mmetsp:Transcript_22310/g.72361  ORF Transcript_22310/g.72361 Transcript_22310/m.72361 type:complete len:226 (+) Transcript_22310:449-1126(+)
MRCEGCREEHPRPARGELALGRASDEEGGRGRGEGGIGTGRRLRAAGGVASGAGVARGGVGAAARSALAPRAAFGTAPLAERLHRRRLAEIRPSALLGSGGGARRGVPLELCAARVAARGEHVRMGARVGARAADRASGGGAAVARRAGGQAWRLRARAAPPARGVLALLKQRQQQRAGAGARGRLRFFAPAFDDRHGRLRRALVGGGRRRGCRSSTVTRRRARG